MMDSSPPQLVEAAIEATPETTPNKPELRNAFRAYSSNSQTARNIWPSNIPNNNARNNSMPSSPMKRDVSKNDYPTTLDIATNKKLMRLISDRGDQQPDVLNISREDQEVNDINSFSESAKNTSGNNENQMEYEESSSTDETDDDNDVTPPLYDPNLYKRVDYIRRVKRLRMYSHCIYSAGTSPADSVNYMPRIPKSNRIKRYNSWPNLKTADVIINSSKSEKKNDQQSSSVGSSSNEAVSAVSHFIEKKPQQNGSIFKKIREDLKAKPFEVVQKSTNSTQTIEYWPSAYEAMFYTIFGEEMRRKQGHEEATTIQTTTVTKTSENANLSPNEMIDKYIQTSLKRKNSNDYRDHIQLLSIQLQFEKHRREIHAERNRRLLGKSRQIKGLEQSNATLMDQVQRLSMEIQSLNRTSAVNRGEHQKIVRNLEEQMNFLSKKYSVEVEKNKHLQRENDLLQLQLKDEKSLRKQALDKVDTLSAENFDLKNLYEDAKVEADRGRNYRDQLKKLESELIIFNEARLKCQQQMEELEAKRARDIEMEYIIQAYSQELADMKHMLEVKTSQIDGCKKNLVDNEIAIQKRDLSIAEQKRLDQAAKEAYEEKFKVQFCEFDLKILYLN
jgi:tuberous sclerosis protein 1